eukprot:gene8376-biopygen6869
MNWSNVISKCESECKRTGVSTHTAMNGGKYYVPGNEFDEFLSAYIEAMNAGKFLSIVEQHRYIGPVIVDIDLRQSVPTRIYDYVDVRMFVKELFKKIAKYVVVPENTQCFVLEKQGPRESNTSDMWKDGVHLVFPDVVTHPCIQHVVRKDMLANWKSFDTDDYLTGPSDMYDEAVIERNGWLMYGSKKPEEKYAWQVAYTVSKDGKVTEGCELSPGELVERLSIRNKYMETALTTEGLQKIQDDQEERVKKEIDRQAATDYCDFADDDESWMMLDSLCALLGEERSKTRTNWMNVGWALNNIPVGESIARRMLWKRFGMLCPTKYDDGEHDRKWSNMGPQRQGPSALGIGSLRMWAKEDNPDEYKKWSSVHKAPAQHSQRRTAATTTEVEGPLTPTQNHEIKLDAVSKELEEMTSSGINQYVELKNGFITFRNAEGIDGTIDRNRYVVKLGSKCHGAMPKTFAMPVSSLEFLKDVPPDCSFDAQLETSNSEISGVTMTSNNYKGLRVRVLNVNSGDERIRVYTDAGSTFINGKRDIKKTMDIVYKQQEMAMQNRFGINQQIFINNGTMVNNNNIIVRSDDDPDYVVMLDQMLEYAKDRRLMKGNGNVYEPIEYCPCAYRVLCDYEDYVNTSLKHNPETYKMLRMHPTRVDSCVKYLQKLKQEESMPQYVVDKDLLSFSNGVLCLSEMLFVPYDGDTSSVMGKVARHHVDCDYTASTDTPIIDKILETNFDDEVASMFYAMVGRLFFEVGKHDDWQVMPYMIGVGGTGKSVLLNTITSCFAEDAVGNLSSKREEVFGSANIFDKEVVVGCDMPAEMSSCIPQVSFQSMTSGDRLEIPRKKEKAVFIKWTTPIIIASNYTPDYKDTGDNIGRRIVSFRFDVAVPKAERDYGLKTKIMETGEIANFIHRALVEYDSLRKRIRGDFWTAVPPIMIEWQSRLAVATNKLHEFLSMDNEDRQYKIEHIEGATTLLSTFKTAYKNVMQCAFEKDAGVFQRFGFRCSDTKETAGRYYDDPYDFYTEELKQPNATETD